MSQIKIGIIETGDDYMGYMPANDYISYLVNYAKYADQLGFNRFWFTEHHHADPINSLWYDPSMLLPIIAHETSKIRVGIAGYQISLHSSYKIALDFKLLSTVFPDRIDLGITRATSDVDISTHEITYVEAGTKIEKVINLLRENNDFGSSCRTIPPLDTLAPEIWQLGMSYRNLNTALENKLNFSRSIYHKGANLNYETSSLKEFKHKYFDRHGIFPTVNLAISIQHQSEKKMLVQTSIAHPATLTGTTEEIRKGILLLAEKYEVDEFILYDISTSPYLKYENLSKISALL